VAQLRDQLEWFGELDTSQYEALCVVDPQFVDDYVRADLKDDFSRLKQRTLERQAEAMEAALAEASQTPPLTRKALLATARAAVAKVFDPEELGTFLLNRFQVAALRGLVKHGRPEDVRLARRFVDSDAPGVRLEALNLLERFGTQADAPRAVALAKVLYKEDQQRAARLASRLTRPSSRVKRLEELRAQPALRRWSVEELAHVPGKAGTKAAFVLLWADDPDVRLAALQVVLTRADEERHAAVLTIYERHRHFYNVVRALDRHLFAPAWLREALLRAES
jgi:hypothetical protein